MSKPTARIYDGWCMCPECGRPVSLTKTGKIYEHMRPRGRQAPYLDRFGQTCDASRKRPEDVLAKAVTGDGLETRTGCD